jgi:2'-5' RNA ligase
MAAGGGLDASFVLTFEMDGESFGELNALRRRYYSPERNVVPAHVTLFYRLPSERRREIKALLSKIAAGERPIEIAISEVKALERGVAIFLRSAQLNALRDSLAREWWPWLTELDRAGFRPHVTIQNNVGRGTARQTQASVSVALRLKVIRGIGLHLWRYREAGWEDEQLFRFR